MGFALAQPVSKNKRGVKMSPASSEEQKTLACIALSIKQGKTPASYSKQASKMAESMTEEQLEHYCKGKVK